MGKGLKRLNWREEKREGADDEKEFDREQVVYDTDSDVDEAETLPMPIITGLPLNTTTPTTGRLGGIYVTSNPSILPAPITAQPSTSMSNEYGYQPHIAAVKIPPVSELTTTIECNAHMPSRAGHAHLSTLFTAMNGKQQA
jgi:hypothetical protein